MRGQGSFSLGRPSVPTRHPAPYYTDNTMHNLMVDRFYQTQTINGMVATVQGPIKTFPLRGIKESPPYFHDGAPADPGRHDRVLQPHSGDEADQRGEEPVGGLHAAIMTSSVCGGRLTSRPPPTPPLAMALRS